MKKGETKKTGIGKQTGHDVSEYIPCEMFLESTGFFTPSSRRIKTIFKKEKPIRRKNVIGQMEEGTIAIKAIHDVGLPSTFDQDLYRAFLKICDEAVSPEGVLPQPLSVPTKKLLRYADKVVSTWSVREAKNWFVVMGGTHIVGEAYNAESKSFEVIGAGVFDTYLIRGQKDKAGETAMTNEVYLSEWFMRNYEAKYFRLFDLTFYNSLKNTFPKRFYHFSKVDGMRRLETPTVNLTADCVKNSFFRTDSLNLESRNSSIQPTMNFRMPDS